MSTELGIWKHLSWIYSFLQNFLKTEPTDTLKGDLIKRIFTYGLFDLHLAFIHKRNVTEPTNTKRKQETNSNEETALLYRWFKPIYVDSESKESELFRQGDTDDLKSPSKPSKDTIIQDN